MCKRTKMTASGILQRIVEENGSCDWSSIRHCRICPLGNTIRNDNTKISCLELVYTSRAAYHDRQMDEWFIFKKAAESLLLELTIQGMLK